MTVKKGQCGEVPMGTDGASCGDSCLAERPMLGAARTAVVVVLAIMATISVIETIRFKESRNGFFAFLLTSTMDTALASR